jgi:hypothetical protein
MFMRDRGWLQMSRKSYGLKWRRREWVVFLAIVVISIAAIAMRQFAGPKVDITGTVSKAEPSTKQDGTPGHPYADASQCSPSTDLVIWPRNDRPIPSIPPGISVCFVGDKSSPDLEVRHR